MSENDFIEQLKQALALSEQLNTFVDKLTERARHALILANEEAQLLDHTYIGTEHLLLGLLHEGTGIAATVLKELGIELHLVRAYVERIVKRGEEPLAPDFTRKMTSRAYVVLGLVANEAWRSSYIGTEHLLLGLVREGEGIAAGGIEMVGGVTLEQVRRRVYQAMLSSGQAVESLKAVVKSKNNVVTCRIDDEDMEAIDALVEVGIRSTRSDAAAWLIHAGIESNSAVLESVYKTVGDIRHLRTRAQALVQQTVKGNANWASTGGNTTPDDVQKPSE